MYSVFEKLLKDRGITAYKVAKDTGVTTATLSSWKTGRYEPKPEKLKIIADYFGVSVDYLMTGEEKESDNKNAPVRQHRSLNRLHSRGMMQYVLLYCIILGQPLQVNRSEFPKSSQAVIFAPIFEELTQKSEHKSQVRYILQSAVNAPVSEIP